MKVSLPGAYRLRKENDNFMSEKSRGRSRKKRPFPVKAVLITAALIFAAAGAGTGYYIHKGKQYETVFFPHTVINGIDVSHKTAEEVKELISSEIEGYVLTVQGRGGDTEQITKDEIGLHSVFDGSLEKYLDDQEPMEWWQHYSKESEYEISTMIAYDEEKLEERIKSLIFFDEEHAQPPKDAYLSEYQSGQGYRVIPEESGSLLDQDKAAAGIADAIMNMKTELSLEELGAYVEPAVTSEDERLNSLAAELNRYVGVTVTYQFGDSREILNGDRIAGWLSVSEDGQVSLSTEEVAAYVKELASKYNTAYQKKTLKTSYGQTVTISGGFYGWRINQSEETNQLYAIIKSGESQTREPVYLQTANSHGENDYGNSYVEINLTAQHLFLYKDGKLIVESDFVSGNHAKGYDTPAGAFPLTYKQKDATLKGEDYRTPVDYWMPFNGNIGMHDAKWRSSFGGSIYKTNGSHGCVNLPPSAAKTIFENISAGYPVLCYHLDGTERKETSKTQQETVPETTAAETAAETTAETQPETTAAVTPSPGGDGTGNANGPSGGNENPAGPSAGTGSQEEPTTALEPHPEPGETSQAPSVEHPEESKPGPGGPGEVPVEPTREIGPGV